MPPPLSTLRTQILSLPLQTSSLHSLFLKQQQQKKKEKKNLITIRPTCSKLVLLPSFHIRRLVSFSSTPLHSLIFRKKMKKLIRRLSRVADSSQYCLLRSNSASAAPTRRISGKSARRRASDEAEPEGHVPVYVGDEMERFTVNAELLNHPVFIWLLNKAAQEYGYEQKGVLRIPCHVLVFERVLQSVRLGLESRDLEDLLGSLFTAEDCL